MRVGFCYSLRDIKRYKIYFIVYDDFINFLYDRKLEHASVERWDEIYLHNNNS